MNDQVWDERVMNDNDLGELVKDLAGTDLGTEIITEISEAVELCNGLWQGNEAAFIYHRHEYDAVLSVCDGADNVKLEFYKPSYYLHIKAPDGNGFSENVLKMSMQFLMDTHGKGCKTLVHCKAGISRSVVIASTYYAIINDMELEDGLERVKLLKAQSGYWNDRWYRLITPSPYVQEIGRIYLMKNREIWKNGMG